MGQAVRVGLTKLEEQKARYRANGIAYNRPWMFLLTDGEPTDPGWQQAASQSKAAELADKLVFFGVGIGAANLAKLEQFSTRKPVLLEGLKFRVGGLAGAAAGTGIIQVVHQCLRKFFDRSADQKQCRVEPQQLRALRITSGRVQVPDGITLNQDKSIAWAQ